MDYETRKQFLPPRRCIHIPAIIVPSATTLVVPGSRAKAGGEEIWAVPFYRIGEEYICMKCGDFLRLTYRARLKGE